MSLRINLSLLVVLTIIFSTTHCQSSNDILALEGTVKWHNSDITVKQLKVSQLKVQLFSLPGETPRQAVNVLPNGAFFVPVSVAGRYRLKLSAPHGWNFIPKDGFDVELSALGPSNPKKYVFELTGFEVKGQVLTPGMATGPSGIYVSALAGKNVISQSTTTGDGSFLLQSVPPGDYIIVVSDSKFVSGLEGSLANTPMQVSTNSIQMDRPIVLQGHTLHSSVTFNGHGIANIPVVLLISKKNALKKSEVSNFGCSSLKRSPSDFVSRELVDEVQLEGSCQVVTDDKGTFSFYRLAGGEYFLVAYHDAALFKSNKLTISPSFHRVVMKHDDMHLKTGFHVTSFHISGGSVQLPSKVPISGAEIFLNGVSLTNSDSNGDFELDVASPGDFTIDVKAPKMVFSTVKAQLSPTTERLPLIRPSEIEICGRFVISKSLKSPYHLPAVEVNSGPRVSPKIFEDGKAAYFCFNLSPHRHVIRLSRAPNVARFEPINVEVDLTNGPVNDLVFSQFHATVTGQLECAELCPSETLGVRLSSPDDVDGVVSSLEPDSNNNKQATFTFSEVSPGPYDLELVVTGGRGGDTQPAGGWCWAEPGLRRRVTVVDRDLHFGDESSLLTFKQTGYRLYVEASLLDTLVGQSIYFSVNSPSGPKDNVTDSKNYATTYYQLTKAVSTICLPMRSSFHFDASTPCLRLGKPAPAGVQSASGQLSITGSPITVSLDVREVPVEAVVEVSANDNFNSSLPHLVLTARFSDKTTKKLSARWESQANRRFARVGLWLVPGEEVTFTVSPVSPASQLDSSVHPLIVPASRTLSVPQFSRPVGGSGGYAVYDEPVGSTAAPAKLSTSECVASLGAAFGGDPLIARFVMKPGFVLNGRVIPPVDQAQVTVHGDASLISSPGGSTPINDVHPPLVRTATDATGTFRIGPFYLERPDAGDLASLLTVRVEKPGYNFFNQKMTVGGDWLTFSSQKLALLEVRVMVEPTNLSLSNALISVIGSTSGDSKTTDSSGVVRYIGLPPGEYYIQPMLKEYEFLMRRGDDGALEAPMEHALNIVDGASLAIDLVARRIAFSVLGQVTSLSGQPETGVLVAARLLSTGEEEEANFHTKTSRAFPAAADTTNKHQSIPSCRAHDPNADQFLVMPLEEATTDDIGQFKLLGLLPGCPYLVTANRKDTEGPRVAAPSSFLVKLPMTDLHGLHFYLKPLVHMGVISASVDTTDEYLTSLSIVVHPLGKPNNAVTRHKFATDSRLFVLSGEQVDSMIGGVYTIQLETTFAYSSGLNTTLKTYNFRVESTADRSPHQHFSFEYRPSLDFTSPSTRV